MNAALDTCYAHTSAWSSAVDMLIWFVVVGLGAVVVFAPILFGVFWVGARLDEYEAIRRIKHNDKVKAVIVELIKKIEAGREETTTCMTKSGERSDDAVTSIKTRFLNLHINKSFVASLPEENRGLNAEQRRQTVQMLNSQFEIEHGFSGAFTEEEICAAFGLRMEE